MVKHVIKKNGEKEPFSEEKLKKAIMAAAKETDLMENRIKEVTENVYKKVLAEIEDMEEVSTRMIRDKALAALDTMEKSVADAWRNYEKSKGAC